MAVTPGVMTSRTYSAVCSAIGAMEGPPFGA